MSTYISELYSDESSNMGLCDNSQSVISIDLLACGIISCVHTGNHDFDRTFLCDIVPVGVKLIQRQGNRADLVDTIDAQVLSFDLGL